jgi:hypothetical protein
MPRVALANGLPDKSIGINAMAEGWKIVSSTARLNGGPPIKEYYLVAIADIDLAITELRDRERLSDAKFIVAGAADSNSLEWLDIQDGEILCVMTVA